MTKFDENTLRELFEEVEPPASLEGRWHRPRVPARPAGGVRLRAAAVIGAVLTIGVVTFGAVASDSVPADDPRLTITDGPTAMNTPSSPSTTAESVSPSSTGEAPVPTGVPPATDRGDGTAKPPPPNQQEQPPIPPARGPLTEWPDAANAGVPPGTMLRSHTGDLHVKTAGEIVYDLRVDGTVYVEAPDVTLRRVQVVPRSGAFAGVRQQAPRLKIEDSEISGMGSGAQFGIAQEAPGLTVQRSYLQRSDTSVLALSDTTLIDSLLGTLSTNGNATRLVISHNTINSITLADNNGPVTEVTIGNNQLGDGTGVVIWAPSGSSSHHIRVTDNHFRHSGGHPAPSSGWNAAAPGNAWTGNVWFGTSEPVTP